MHYIKMKDNNTICCNAMFVAIASDSGKYVVINSVIIFCTYNLIIYSIVAVF